MLDATELDLVLELMDDTTEELLDLRLELTDDTSELLVFELATDEDTTELVVTLLELPTMPYGAGCDAQVLGAIQLLPFS